MSILHCSDKNATCFLMPPPETEAPESVQINTFNWLTLLRFGCGGKRGAFLAGRRTGAAQSPVLPLEPPGNRIRRTFAGAGGAGARSGPAAQAKIPAARKTAGELRRGGFLTAALNWHTRSRSASGRISRSTENVLEQSGTVEAQESQACHQVRAGGILHAHARKPRSPR